MTQVKEEQKAPESSAQAHFSLLEELKKARPPIRNANIVHKESLTNLDRLAIWVTRRVGSIGFFAIIFIWTACWLTWNTLGPADLRFDPFPAFVLWLFLSNMIQIFLMPLIMIGQNLDARHSEARAEADFEVNIKAEKEVEVILTHLEEQNHLMFEIMKRQEAQHQEIMYRIGQLDPELAQQLGVDLRLINTETQQARHGSAPI